MLKWTFTVTSCYALCYTYIIYVRYLLAYSKCFLGIFSRGKQWWVTLFYDISAIFTISNWLKIISEDTPWARKCHRLARIYFVFHSKTFLAIFHHEIVRIVNCIAWVFRRWHLQFTAVPSIPKWLFKLSNAISLFLCFRLVQTVASQTDLKTEWEII